MNINSEQLFKALELDSLNDTFRVNALKDWCSEHISRDIHFTGEASYSFYVELAQEYLDLFIPSTQVEPRMIKVNQDYLTPCHYAAYRGFDRWIECSTPSLENELNEGNASKMTPLHLAAQFGHVHTVDALLAKRAALTINNELGELPLHVALATPLSFTYQLRDNKESIARKLFQSDPSTLAYPDREGNTALHRMASHGYDQLISDVLNLYPKSALQCNNHGRYPIHSAILNNQINAAQRLLSIPQVATLADAEYRVAIHYAALYGTKEMMELCSSVTNDLNISDTEGKTAFMLANRAGNHEAEEVLSSHSLQNVTSLTL